MSRSHGRDALIARRLAWKEEARTDKHGLAYLAREAIRAIDAELDTKDGLTPDTPTDPDPND